MYDYQVREMHIEANGRRIFGKLYTPDGREKCPAIILSHGYNGVHADFDGECRFYAAHGYAALALDFCGGSTRSRSSGKTTDMTLFTEKEDLLAALDCLRSLPQVTPQRVYLMGGSQGGLVTALAAAEHADLVRGVALYFPAVCIPENWKQNYPTIGDIPEVTDFWGMQLGRAFFTSMRDLDPFAVIGGYTGPVLLITGDQDPIVTVSSVRRTADCYSGAEMLVLPGEGHGFSPEGNRTAMERVLAFMEK